MANLQKIIKETKNGVYLRAQEAITFGYDYVRYEKDYGNATVNVTISEVRMRNGFYYDDVDVWVSHDDTDHQSPLLEQAIREALPNWWDIKKEVEARQIA